MKNLFFLIAISLFYFQPGLLFAQDFETVEANFWKAVDEDSDKDILENGFRLITYMKEQRTPFDSIFFEIRWSTAVSLQKVDRLDESLAIHLETLSLVEKKWGRVNLYYGLVSVLIGSIYNQLNKFDLSLNYLIEARKVLNKSSEDNGYYDYIIVNNLSQAYLGKGNYTKALDYALESYEITRLLEAEFADLQLQSLNNLSVIYSELGEYEKSLQYGLLALDLCLKQADLEDTVLATVLSSVASSYSDKGDYNKALEYNMQALELRGKVVGKKHPDYASSLNNIASNYSHLGDYTLSMKYNIQALELREKIFGKEHLDYALSLNNIAADYSDLGNYPRALEYNMQALEIRRKLVGNEHPDYVMSLNNIASDYSALGNYLKSLEYNLIALEIGEKILGENHPDIAHSLNNICVDYINIGNYSKGLEYALKALEIRERVLGKNHLDYASSLSNIGVIYSKMGMEREALDFYFRSLHIKEEILGAYHHEYASALDNIACAYIEIGNYSSALNLQIEALDVFKRTFGMEHPSYVICLSNIAQSYAHLGDYQKSIEIQSKVLAINERTTGKEHADYALTLHNMASLYIDIEDYEQALKCNKEALDLRLRLFGSKNSDYVKTLNNLAVNYMYIGNYSKALEYNLKSLRTRQRILGVNHPDYILSLTNVSSTYLKLGKYTLAYDYCLKANEKYELNQNLIYDYSINLRNLAFLELKRGDTKNAKTHYVQSCLSLERLFSLNRFGLDPALVISSKKEVDNSFFVSCSLLSRDSSLSNLASRSWFNLNGIVGSEAASLESQIESSGDTAMVHLMGDLKLNKKQLAKYRELTKEEKTSRGIDEKALEDEVSKQERELSKQSKAFADFNRRFNLNDVSSALKGDEVFADIARVPYFSTYTNQWTDSVKYLVFIHDAKDTLVDYRFIDNGKELEGDVFADYKIDCSNQANATDLKNALYYNAFWKPIADKIGSSKTVYVSLGGVYNNINLNTLYNPETGKYLVEEKDIRIVNNARDFILSKEQTARTYTSTSTALYGFPDYNGNETTTKDTTDYLALTRDLDPLWIDSLTRGGLKAAPLPATKVEVEQIAKSFKENGWQVSEYLGDKASETKIKQEESPRVLHIATHGYFFDDIPTDKSNNERFLGMDRQRVVQDPMLRSGLLFTGANKTLQGEKVEGENGLLSASEASLLNLRGTELVVLSACETGKGEVKNSEGVYGLRKAFSDAGAANTIMSLWKVDDKVTQEFMTRFYEIWLNEKTSIREAFNRTQLEIKAKYPQPYYWGAFVLVGK